MCLVRLDVLIEFLSKCVACKFDTLSGADIPNSMYKIYRISFIQLKFRFPYIELSFSKNQILISSQGYFLNHNSFRMIVPTIPSSCTPEKSIQIITIFHIVTCVSKYPICNR